MNPVIAEKVTTNIRRKGYSILGEYGSSDIFQVGSEELNLLR